jgi:hypothetical protein
MELEKATDRKHLGIKVWVLRIGCLSKNNNYTTFDAKQQAKRFFCSHGGFDAGWKPKRLRATRQANEFLCNTAFALTLILAEERKEAEKKKGYDGDGDAGDDDDSDESEDEESVSFKTPKKPTSDPTKPPPTEVKFDMNDAHAAPIKWKSRNGKAMTAIRVPRAGTRKSFRKLAQQTGWINNVVESLYNEDKVPAGVAVDWLVEGIFDRYRSYFDAFCERKGYMLPTMARMPPTATAAMWIDGNVNYSVQRIINQHCYAHYRRWLFAKEKDVRGFGDTAMMPTIGVYTNEHGQHIFYWWKPPDDMLGHEINSVLNEGNVNKLVSVDFSTGGDHGKGRYRHILTMALRFDGDEPSIVRRYVIGEIDSAKDSTTIMKETFMVDLNNRLMLLASGDFVVTQGEDGKYGLQFSNSGVPIDHTVVKSVKSRIFVCGDAKFYMQILGREHSAPHWCVWCDINVRQFDFENYPTVNLWTNESMDLHRKKGLSGPALMGMTSAPTLTICQPSNFLPNVVHQKINTGNDIIACLYKFTDRRVEMVTEEESKARAEALAAEVSLIDCTEVIKEYVFACRAVNISVAEAKEKEVTEGLDSEEQKQLEEDEEELEMVENELCHYQEVVLPYAKKEHVKLKKTFETLWKARRRVDNQVRNHIDHNIFQKHNMRTHITRTSYKSESLAYIYIGS